MVIEAGRVVIRKSIDCIYISKNSWSYTSRHMTGALLTIKLERN